MSKETRATEDKEQNARKKTREFQNREQTAGKRLDKFRNRLEKLKTRTKPLESNWRISEKAANRLKEIKEFQ